MSVRTVQTDFTSSSWSYSPLHPVPMNAQQTPQQQHNTRYAAGHKFPPGLGYSLPAATESSPSLIAGEQRPTTTRRRSGGFTYPSGQTYHHGQQQHHSHPPHTGMVNFAPPQVQSRRRLAPQFNHSNTGTAVPQRRAPSPPHASLPAPIKFDPFASDDTPSTEPVYNHYWQYNSTTKSPMLVYKNKPASSSPQNGPYTIKLPTQSTISLPATTTSTPSYRTSSVARISQPPLPKPDRNARAKLVAGILLNRIYAVGKPMRRRFLGGSSSDKTYVPSGLSSVISLDL